MGKIYFDRERGIWWTDSLEDIYSFNYLNIENNIIEEGIISWNRNADKDNEDTIRIYDFDLYGKKYFFKLKYEDAIYKIIPKKILDIEKLLSESGIKFVGEDKNIN